MWFFFVFYRSLCLLAVEYNGFLFLLYKFFIIATFFLVSLFLFYPFLMLPQLFHHSSSFARSSYDCLLILVVFPAIFLRNFISAAFYFLHVSVEPTIHMHMSMLVPQLLCKLLMYSILQSSPFFLNIGKYPSCHLLILFPYSKH